MQTTVSDSATAKTHARARELAQRWGLEYRRRRSVDWSEPVLVVTRGPLSLRWPGGELRWHPGMLHALRATGWAHPIPRLAGLGEGDAVLDATLGLGTEARFLAELTGHTVVGVEVAPAVAALTSEGLRSVGAAVQVVHAHSLQVLADSADASFDLVYADPLFPARKNNDRVTTGLAGLRAGGCPWTPDAGWLAEARRVARKAVVIKDLAGGRLLEGLGAHEIAGRRRQRARYGVWRGVA